MVFSGRQTLMASMREEEREERAKGSRITVLRWLRAPAGVRSVCTLCAGALLSARRDASSAKLRMQCVNIAVLYAPVTLFTNSSVASNSNS